MFISSLFFFVHQPLIDVMHMYVYLQMLGNNSTYNFFSFFFVKIHLKN